MTWRNVKKKNADVHAEDGKLRLFVVLHYVFPLSLLSFPTTHTFLAPASFFCCCCSFSSIMFEVNEKAKESGHWYLSAITDGL